jgi:hypothetical protein
VHLDSDRQHHWGVIFARGEGAGLKSLARFISGEDTPKQFAETEYGRIEATPAMSTDSQGGLLKAKRFWEKPFGSNRDGDLANCTLFTLTAVKRGGFTAFMHKLHLR